MFIEQEEFNKRIELVTNSQFNGHQPAFFLFLRLTLVPFFRNGGGYSLATQLGMLQSIAKFETTIREGRKLLKSEKDKKKQASYQKAIEINQACIKTIKTIADGVAWRCFACHRPRLTIMSDNASSGYQNPDYSGLEILKNRKGFFIINDLTRYLRIGDVTRVFKGGKLVIEEFKDNGVSIRNMGTILAELKKYNRKANSQEERLLTVQKAIMNDSLIVQNAEGNYESKADFVTLNFKVSSHTQKMSSLIRKANKTGYVHAHLEDGYFVEIHAYDKLFSLGDDFEKTFERMKQDYNKTKPAWLEDQKTDTESLTNYDAFAEVGDEFPRNITPASILPFSIKDRLRIISGHLFIRVNINTEVLKNKLREAGWEVEDTTTMDPELKSRKDFVKKRNETKGKFSTYGDHVYSPFKLIKTVDERKFYIIFPYELIPIAMSSYHSLDFIVKAVEGIYQERGRYQAGSVMLNFAGEKEIFCKTHPSALLTSVRLGYEMVKYVIKWSLGKIPLYGIIKSQLNKK